MAHRTTHPWLLFVGLVAVLGGGCAPDSAPPAPPPLAVTTVKPARGVLREAAEYVGTARASREAQILARLGGTLVSFEHPEGAEIKRGDRLATVAAPEQHERLRRAESEVARLRADAEHACETAATDHELLDRGVLARAQVDASQTRCKAKRAALSAARSARREVRAVTERRTEYAAFDGRVLRWLAEPGEHVAPGRPLLSVGSHEMEIRLDVVERDLRRGVSAGTPAFARLANGREVEGAVSRVAPTSRGPARVVETIVPLPREASEGLPHGSSADVRLVLRETEESWLLPEDTLEIGEKTARIYRIRDGVLEAVEVEALLKAKGQVALRGDLRADDAIVLAEGQPLEEGARVFAVGLEETRR